MTRASLVGICDSGPFGRICPRCNGSGVDPVAKGRVLGDFMAPENCLQCAGDRSVSAIDPLGKVAAARRGYAGSLRAGHA